METRPGGAVPAHDRTLKPSLVEWKLLPKQDAEDLGVTLKPSLVEWKPLYPERHPLGERALKPSLVEWKPKYVAGLGHVRRP